MPIYQIDRGRFAGRFIIAYWSGRNAQYTSSNRVAPFQGYAGNYSRRLEDLADLGIRTYATRAAARAAARRMGDDEDEDY